MEKTCTKCGEKKDAICFNSLGGSGHLHSHCKACRYKYKKLMASKRSELKDLSNDDFYKKLKEIKQKAIALPSFDNGSICKNFEEMNRIF